MAITRNMSEGLVLLNRSSTILLINKSAQSLFGTTDDICVGKSILALNRSLELQQAADAALAGNSTQEMLHLGSRSYQVLANPVWADGTVTGALILILDVTERENAEILRREFSANVSHELKTPLTSICGYAEIMKDGVARPEDMQRFACRIYDESTRMVALIEDIIKLSHLDENSVEEKRENVDLLALCAFVAEALSESAKKRNVILHVQGDAAKVNGVKRVLEEIVYNLVDNGIKYNRPGGTVRMEVLSRADGVDLVVADTGIGIPPAHQPKVFERFYRVDKSHSKETGGTGLGLSIVKHGALFHGATVDLESVENAGTKITVHFPKADQSE